MGLESQDPELKGDEMLNRLSHPGVRTKKNFTCLVN